MASPGPAIRHAYIVGAGKLVPADYEAHTALGSIPLGEKIEVVIYRQRDPRFSALVYLTCNRIGEAMKWRARNVRGWLAIKTGHSDYVRWPPDIPGSFQQHRTVLVPHGTGPADMNQAELEVFWDEAKPVIREEILPFVEPEAAEQIGWRLDDMRDWK